MVWSSDAKVLVVVVLVVVLVFVVVLRFRVTVTEAAATVVTTGRIKSTRGERGLEGDFFTDCRRLLLVHRRAIHHVPLVFDK